MWGEGLDPLNRGKVAHPSTCLLTQQTGHNKSMCSALFYEIQLFPQKLHLPPTPPPAQQGSLHFAVYLNFILFYLFIYFCRLTKLSTTIEWCGLSHECLPNWHLALKKKRRNSCCCCCCCWSEEWKFALSTQLHAALTPAHTRANTRANGGVPYITWIVASVPDVIKGEVANCRAV